MGIALEEADESLYWTELLVEAKIVEKHRLEALMQENNEIINLKPEIINLKSQIINLKSQI